MRFANLCPRNLATLVHVSLCRKGPCVPVCTSSTIPGHCGTLLGLATKSKTSAGDR